MSRTSFAQFISGQITSDYPDLHHRVLLLCQGIINAHDEGAGFLPYFYTDVRNGRLTYQHSDWALDDSVFRNISALARAYQMTREPALLPYLRRMIPNALKSLEIGGGINAAGDRALMHNLSRGLMALCALAEVDDRKVWSNKIGQFLSGLLEIYSSPGSESGQEYELATGQWRSTDALPATCGRTIGALVRCYEATADERALDLAKRFVCANLSCFAEDGGLLPAAGTHVHSIADTLQGILAYALLTSDRNRIEHGERIYRHGLKSYGIDATGWFAEHAHHDRCCSDTLRRGGEICCTANMISSAILLGRAGYAYAFEDAERYIRNMLFASQLVDLSSVEISEPREPRWPEFQRRLVGNVAGFPAVNGAFDESSPHLTQLCCPAQAVEALVDAANAGVTSSPSGLSVNLFFSTHHPDARITSHLPRAGILRIMPIRDANTKIKAPSWSPADSYALRKGGSALNPIAALTEDGYLDAGFCRAGKTIEFKFQLPRYRTIESCHLQSPVRFAWRGNTIVGCDPAPALLPFYADRQHLRQRRRAKRVVQSGAAS